VSAGDFDTVTVETGGTEVTVGGLPGADTSAEELAEDTIDAIRRMEERFGPSPYDTLTVPLVTTGDDHGGGEEYASSIVLGGEDFDLILHEVAHMWFYGMVGNSQFRDPWMDEAFASFSESLGPDAHTPEDVARALAELEPALDVLLEAGALDRRDLASDGE
jgi:predicted metalloprotease with PDZ domain